MSWPRPSPIDSGVRPRIPDLRSTAPIDWRWAGPRHPAKKPSPWNSSATSPSRNSRWPCSISMGSSMSLESCQHSRPTRTRREFIRDGFCGFGGLALASLLNEERVRAGTDDPLSAKPPHHPAKARAVIFLFMAGGPSHLDTFDPKPLLNRLHGQVRPKEFGEAKYQFVSKNAKLLGSRRTFQKYGESGIEVSDLFPHLSQCVDDMAVIRSCHGDMVVHSAAQYELFSGRIVPGFPSMGSWVCYGLGSESRSLPAYVVMPDAKGALEAGQPMYMHGFLPAVYQPTMFRPGDTPGAEPGPAPGIGLARRRNDLATDPRAERGHSRSGGPGIPRPDQRVRPGIPDADRSPRSPRHLARAAGNAQPLRHRVRADKRLRPALPPGEEAGREWRAIRLRGLRRRSRQFAVGCPRQHRGKPREKSRRDGSTRSRACSKI